jgi:hypothetical protein
MSEAQGLEECGRSDGNELLRIPPNIFYLTVSI